MEGATTTQPLAGFTPATRSWFCATFAGPTGVQSQAWAAIQSGHNTLVIAPTGSGKTLAAFLSAIDKLSSAPPSNQCEVIYVSPLKALAADVERNLKAPLRGIQAATQLDQRPTPISVATRTADTSASERRAFANRGANIMITTPESLFLLLTSAAHERLRSVKTIIIDEIHAMAATKRGTHLALSLERLDELTAAPVQRIGLSATIRPVDEVARLLGGEHEVTIVDPPAAKRLDIEVALASDPSAPSSWPAVEESIFAQIKAHNSTIVFANSRRLAERLCTRLNELADENQPSEAAPFPARVIGQSGIANGAAPVIARAHHGSISAQERRDIEEALKNGELPAVVATSSLELGIDMGAVDLVIQLGAPPSIAAGLQRVGRAGHHVGAASQGILYPQHRADLLHCTVSGERMGQRTIEQLRYPRNPLDVLTQQLAAMVSIRPWRRDDLLALVRKAAPYHELTETAFDSVLDLLSGRYASDEFAQLKPRVVWDRTTDVITARPGTHQAVVSTAGTIPDRGMFGVFLPAEDATAPRRVGELDEEMVYESRVGDVFLLGSTSWRITEITQDQVRVLPAPGQSARMPFWKGDSPARPAELGRAMGAFCREITAASSQAAHDRLTAAGLTEPARDALMAYLEEQGPALPTDKRIVVEQFRDELGDWRLLIHSLFGDQINGAWALAIAARFRASYGVDPQVLHSDDGIVFRLPDFSDATAADWATLIAFDPAEIESLVAAELGGSPMLGARFRECAARAMLIPRRRPGQRTPLWLQRQRAAQLLQAAAGTGSFPILAEALRECLTDVFDLAGLREICAQLASGEVSVHTVTSATPSVFGRSLLFGYLGEFVYRGDVGIAEQRATLLSVDPELLAELIGHSELRELLSSDAIAATEAELQYLTEQRQARNGEDVADLLRNLGPLSEPEAVARGAQPRWLSELAIAGRIIEVEFAGAKRWAAIEDAGRLHSALGIAIPSAVAAAFAEPMTNPLVDLVSRYARTHGPFGSIACAQHFGLPIRAVERALHDLSDQGRVVSGEFTPGGVGQQWCDTGVLRLLRRRSLAILRNEIEPVPTTQFAEFSLRWHGASGSPLPDLPTAIAMLQGYPMSMSTVEHDVLPKRLTNYQSAELDTLIGTGVVTWCGAGVGAIQLAFSDLAPQLFSTPEPLTDNKEHALHHAVLSVLTEQGAIFFERLAAAVGETMPQPVLASELTEALWDLVWRGYLTNDSLAPVRARLARPIMRPRQRPHSRPRMPTRFRGGGPNAITSTASSTSGRWALVAAASEDPTRRAHARTKVLLTRHGVLTPAAIAAENTREAAGGLGGLYPVLSAMETNGEIRRGYFVAGLGGSQFAHSEALDELRKTKPSDSAITLLTASDPANPYGAALSWPTTPADAGQPSRRAGAFVAIRGGDLLAFGDRHSIVAYPAAAQHHRALAAALHNGVAAGAIGSLSIERINGTDAAATPLGQALRVAGFRTTPKALRADNNPG